MRIECRGVLFDLDGVLVDSTPAVERVWTRWAEEHQLDARSVVKQAHGRPSIATIRELLPHADHAAEDRKVARWEIEDSADVVALPGAAELLRTLPESRWAVVTSGTRALATARLRAAGLPVPQGFVTANDIQNGKPHPEPYLLGAKRLALRAEECVAIEDAPAGIRAARAAGTRVIAVRTTTEAAELRESGADWILADLSRVSAHPNGGCLALTFTEE